MDFKMALLVLSPAWMRQAPYEKALLDIDGDKDVSSNELFLRGRSDPAPQLVSNRLYCMASKTAFKNMCGFCQNFAVFVMIFLAKKSVNLMVLWK